MTRERKVVVAMAIVSVVTTVATRRAGEDWPVTAGLALISLAASLGVWELIKWMAK